MVPDNPQNVASLHLIVGPSSTFPPIFPQDTSRLLMILQLFLGLEENVFSTEIDMIMVQQEKADPI
jgi:hypothetical protein